MKFVEGVAEQVIWAASDCMVHFNLLLRMIKHYVCLYELNETLKDLIEFLAIRHRVAYRLLNPEALPFVSQQNSTKTKY